MIFNIIANVLDTLSSTAPQADPGSRLDVSMQYGSLTLARSLAQMYSEPPRLSFNNRVPPGPLCSSHKAQVLKL